MSVELAVDGIFASRLAVSSADTRILLLFILLNVSNVDSYLHERLYLLFDILMNFIYEDVVSNSFYNSAICYEGSVEKTLI